ncbi:MAG: transglutaminase-like domain-containing protein [Polyangiaceae bacterium]
MPCALRRTPRLDLDKVKAVYGWVVENTRYVALELGVYGYKPYRAVQTVARGWGDCKDKATAIVTLLKSLGIDSTIVILRTQVRGDFKSNIASLAVFDHAIAYVPSLDLYLDGTAEGTGIGELPVMDRGALALRIQNGNAELVRLPEHGKNADVIKRNVVAQLEPSGAGTLELHATASGAVAPEWRHSYEAEATRRERITSELGREFPGLQLNPGNSGFSAAGLDDTERDVSIELRGKSPELAHSEGSQLQHGGHPIDSAPSHLRCSVGTPASPSVARNAELRRRIHRSAPAWLLRAERTRKCARRQHLRQLLGRSRKPRKQGRRPNQTRPEKDPDFALRVHELPAILRGSRQCPRQASRRWSPMRRLTRRFVATVALGLLGSLTVGGCQGGSRPPKTAVEELRRNAAHTDDVSELERWMAAELLEPKGRVVEVRRARSLIERAGGPKSARGELAFALDNHFHGRLRAAPGRYLRAAEKARVSTSDPDAEALAWTAVHYALDLKRNDPTLFDSWKAWVEQAVHYPMALGWRARGELADWWLSESTKNGNAASTRLERSVREFGCVETLRLAGPFGHGAGRDLLRSFPAEQPGPWPSRFTAEAGIAKAPSILKTERTGCIVEASEPVDDGIFYVETYLDVERTARCDLERPGGTQRLRGRLPRPRTRHSGLRYLAQIRGSSPPRARPPSRARSNEQFSQLHTGRR